MDSCWRYCFDGNYLLTTFTHRFISVFCLCVIPRQTVGVFFFTYFLLGYCISNKRYYICRHLNKNKMKEVIQNTLAKLNETSFRIFRNYDIVDSSRSTYTVVFYNGGKRQYTYDHKLIWNGRIQN